MTSPKPPSRRATPSLAGVAARTVACFAAVVWGVLFFGVIDLLVVPIQDERFYDFYLVETGWGLLYTVLVAAPLVVFAVRPGSRVLLLQLVVVAAAVLVCALVVPAPRQAVPAVLLAVTALLLSLSSGQQLLPSLVPWPHRVDRWLGSLVLVAASASVWYAAEMIQAARDGTPDDDTWGLMHLPMQAAFGLALAGSAAVTWLAEAAASPGWRMSAVPSAVAAGWIGVVSMTYPDHLGSLGSLGGAAAIAWGVVFAATTMTGRQVRHHAEVDPGTDQAVPTAD